MGGRAIALFHVQILPSILLFDIGLGVTVSRLFCAQRYLALATAGELGLPLLLLLRLFTGASGVGLSGRRCLLEAFEVLETRYSAQA